MIVRDKPTIWRLFFITRGSIVPRIMGRLAAVVLLSVGVVIAQDAGLLHAAPVAALPFSLIGIALSIFAAFRNSACYDRWWEGRKVWGQMLVDTRSIVRHGLVYVAAVRPDEVRPLALHTIAFVAALRDMLRDEGLSALALASHAPSDRPGLAAARNAPNLILVSMSREIAAWLARGRLTPQMAQVMEDRVIALAGALAASERIKSTPVPYAYSLLLHRTAYLFCFLLPFGLVSAAGPWTPVAVAVVCYTFFGLDALGDELEAPFGPGVNALPLDAITRIIEMNLLEMLGDPALPPSLAPVGFVLR